MERTFIAACVIGSCAFVAARAGTLSVSVRDSTGASVRDAVVYAQPIGGVKQNRKPRSAVIDQINQQFVPYVSAIQVGTTVNFPNKDNIRHHVYSFSPAKKFELPLYAGVPAEPVLFDREGVVTLGCNIHDWMLAYVVILGTPYFRITGGEGLATLDNLPADSYRVQVWQPRMKASPEAIAQTVQIGAGGNQEITFALELKPDWRSKKGPSLNPEGYR